MSRPRTGVAVPVAVLQGIRRAQEAPDVDKHDLFAVIVSAGELGEDAALDWLLVNPLRYSEGVSNGFVEEA